jgi:hypothetical protein
MIDFTEFFGSHIITSIKEFLVTEHCPIPWRGMDLYLIRDQNVVFYIGQSSLAYDRLWQHLFDGYKGRSSIGRFILVNWRSSTHFTIELFSSLMSGFQDYQNNPNRIEKYLIELTCPCFNAALNKHPTALPDYYNPPDRPEKMCAAREG